MMLVCGSALVDMLINDGGARQIPGEAFAGGSSLNVAIGLARLGTPVAFFAGISSDPFGRFLARRLAEEGVDGRYLVHSDRLTTVSIVATMPDGQPAYAFHAKGTADVSLGLDDIPRELDDAIRVIEVGCYTLGVDPTGPTLLALAEREAGRRVISVDPNLRPGIVAGPGGDLGPWRARFERFAAAATIIKASDEDIHVAFPGESIAERAQRWRAAGASLVVVTRGAKGAVAFGPSGMLEVAGRSVPVVDTVGAGDTFHAALLTALDRRGWLDPVAIRRLDADILGESLTFAVTASSITCTRRGPDLPTAADVAAVLG